MNQAVPSVFRVVRSLVLASASPRRQDFLREIGLPRRIVRPPAAAEPGPFPGEKPAAFAARAAKAKADAVFAMLDGKEAVLGADTVVHLGPAILGKPENEAQALNFLLTLAGRSHTVRTACHLRLEDGGEEAFHGEAAVRMASWPESALRAYAATGEGLDKAGAYAVQGKGAFLVESVTGSWSSVIGLPVAETVAALVRHGIIAILSIP